MVCVCVCFSDYPAASAWITCVGVCRTAALWRTCPTATWRSDPAAPAALPRPRPLSGDLWPLRPLPPQWPRPPQRPRGSSAPSPAWWRRLRSLALFRLKPPPLLLSLAYANPESCWSLTTRTLTGERLKSSQIISMISFLILLFFYYYYIFF